MKRPLIAAVRPAGSSDYTFVVHGRPDNRFPPARLQGPLRELARWIGDAPALEGVPALELLPARPRLKAL